MHCRVPEWKTFLNVYPVERSNVKICVRSWYAVLLLIMFFIMSQKEAKRV